ncbi:hypothetical protein AYL99_01172 [Fonsecaea erecta]|uniref:Heterokaryon incompatibility domain-containing protein n=1 Tax=Fonsecaea erecta TaxID=1367422 RepID=A0A178ZZA2_9EURO|nr:hypothetical protein AYL99_01172 [Fonsecaea erecta]OAP65200.1 hypothetical protein AYL99_01172 [Fonsecaea erecta]
MTTSTNMINGLRQIAWEALPATFQDAATVARSLNYRYLWIDSLCIIQDTDDLFVQLRKMPDIYQNAVLVISADSSINTVSGFLTKPRHPTKKIPARSTRGSFARFRKAADGPELLFNDLSRIGVSHRFFMPRGDNGMVRVPNSQEMAARNVVFERAWCFQERLLASRVLHFTADELVWECRTGSDCECGWMRNATNALVGEKCRTLKEDFHRPRRENTGIYNLTGNSAWDRWKQIIATYSACKLTKDADRLLAISAVARQLQSEELGDYYAGLWANAFPGCLLWCSADEPSEYDTQTSAVIADYASRSPPQIRSAATESALRQSATPTHSRPVEYVAPSWSWASVKGRVQFRLESRLSFSKILDVHVQPRSGHDVYGQLESASLLLQAPAVAATLELYHPKVQLARELSALEAWVVINADCQGTVFLDACKAPEGHTSEERDVVCVFLDSPRAHHGRPSYQALVLERCDSPTGAYRRFGMAEFPLTEAQKAELNATEPKNERHHLVARVPTFLTNHGARMQEIRII